MKTLLVDKYITDKYLNNKNQTDTYSNNINSLIDLLIIRVERNSLNNVFYSLVDKLYNLKIITLNKLISNNEFTNIDYHITEYIKESYLIEKNYKLNTQVIKVLETYKKIISKIQPDIKLASDIELQDVPSFTAISKIIKSIPIKESTFIIKWIESSLKLDFGLILSDLINEQTIPNNIIEPLIVFLRESIEVYGASASILNLWQPDKNDEEQIIRNIKILSSKYDVQIGNFDEITENELNLILT